MYDEWVCYISGPQPVGRGPVPVRRPIGIYYIIIIINYAYRSAATKRLGPLPYTNIQYTSTL